MRRARVSPVYVGERRKRPCREEDDEDRSSRKRSVDEKNRTEPVMRGNAGVSNMIHARSSKSKEMKLAETAREEGKTVFLKEQEKGKNREIVSEGEVSGDGAGGKTEVTESLEMGVVGWEELEGGNWSNGFEQEEEWGWNWSLVEEEIWWEWDWNPCWGNLNCGGFEGDDDVGWEDDIWHLKDIKSIPKPQDVGNTSC